MKLFYQEESNRERYGTLIPYGLAMILQIFLPCYFANAIQSECNQFVDAIMTSQWIESDPKYKKLLMIFMVNLKTPYTIRILKVFMLNIETFKNVRIIHNLVKEPLTLY